MDSLTGIMPAGVIIVLCIVSIPCHVAGSDMESVDPVRVTWGPFLTNTTTDSITVNWVSALPYRGEVTYSGYGDQGSPAGSATDGNATIFHHVRIVNLSPGTTYDYSVTGSSGKYRFQTFPVNGSFRFIVYGDTRDQLPQYTQDDRHRLVAEKIAAERDILFILNTGDLVQDAGNEEDWNRFFEAAGQLLPNVTYIPATGNHEEGSGLFEDIFGIPPQYSFDCGNLRVMILDDNPGTLTSLGGQADRVEEEFSGWTGWKVVAFHQPIFSSRPDRDQIRADLVNRWEPVFVRNNVSAVFSAHVHAYEHYKVDGIHYFTVATGGAPPYVLSRDKPPGHQASIEDTLGYVLVTVDQQAGVMTVQYIEAARVEGKNVTPHGSEVREQVVIPSPGRIRSPGSTRDVQTLLDLVPCPRFPYKMNDTQPCTRYSPLWSARMFQYIFNMQAEGRIQDVR